MSIPGMPSMPSVPGQNDTAAGAAPVIGSFSAANTATPDRARPFFPGMFFNPQNNIRGYFDRACCGLRPGGGPNVPEHWLDGGSGWVTRHFYDVESYRYSTDGAGALGVHKCKTCNFEVRGEEFGCGPCKAPVGNAPVEMETHLAEAHGITEPPKRQWATGLCDCQGCCNACLCWQAQASRQIMAAHGHADTLNCCWCLIFCFCGKSGGKDKNGKSQGKAATIFFAALANRAMTIQLNSVDESLLCMIIKSFCCPICSICQTYREHSAAGVWPGGCCNGFAPPEITMDNPPAGVQPGMIAGEKSVW